MYWFLYWSFAFIIFFAHLKKKSILKQWKTLKFYYFILKLIARNVLNVFAFEIVNKKLFFIVSRIYESHKSYHSKTIKAKMLIHQYDNKKNEWKYNQTHSNLKKKKRQQKKIYRKTKITRWRFVKWIEALYQWCWWKSNWKSKFYYQIKKIFNQIFTEQKKNAYMRQKNRKKIKMIIDQKNNKWNDDKLIDCDEEIKKKNEIIIVI